MVNLPFLLSVSQGKGYSIRSIVADLNKKDGVPVYYSASSMPTLTAKTAMTAFMSFWKGDDTIKVAFAPKFYLQSDFLKTGWLNDNGVWYYLNSDGAMKTGWLNDNGTWYYLNDNGSMASNTVIDGYTLDASGAWIN